MKYKILDTVFLKNSRYELLEVQEDNSSYKVAKITNNKINFLYESRNYFLANKFYEKKIGVK